MKTSTAGKALGPQSNKWTVGSHETAPVIVSPGGRILRLQQLHYGGWVPSPFDPADTKFFVEAANAERDKNALVTALRQIALSYPTTEEGAVLASMARDALNEHGEEL